MNGDAEVLAWRRQSAANATESKTFQRMSSYPCATCGAAPGQVCTGPTFHSSRYEQDGAAYLRCEDFTPSTQQNQETK